MEDPKYEEEIVNVLADDVSSYSASFQNKIFDEKFDFATFGDGTGSNSFITGSHKPIERQRTYSGDVYEGREGFINGAFNNLSKSVSADLRRSGGIYNSCALNSNDYQQFAKEPFMTDFEKRKVPDGEMSQTHFDSALTRELKLHIGDMEMKNREMLVQLESLKEFNSSQSVKFADNENKMKRALGEKNAEIQNLKAKLEELIAFCKNEKKITEKNEKTLKKLMGENKVLEERIHEQNVETKNTTLNFEKRLQEETSKTKDLFERNQMIAKLEIITDRLKSENQILQEKNDYIVKRLEETMATNELLKGEKTELENQLCQKTAEKTESERLLERELQVVQNDCRGAMEENERMKRIRKCAETEHEQLEAKVETLIMAEKKLMDSIDEIKLKKNTLSEECTRLRLEANSLKNEAIQKNNSLSLLAIEKDKVKRRNEELSRQNESLNNILKVFETKREKIDLEKKDLTEKQNTSGVVIQSLKKELSKLSCELNSMKAIHKESEKNLRKMKEMQLSKENEILDLEALVEVSSDRLQTIRPRHFSANSALLEGVKPPSLLQCEHMSKAWLIEKIRELEMTLLRQESHIKHLCAVLSCYKHSANFCYDDAAMLPEKWVNYIGTLLCWVNQGLIY